MSPEVNLTVAQFVETCNQALEYSFTGINIEGEVASFKINQGKWVFFDLKEGEYSVNCFMPLACLNVALEDGMKVRVKATPKLTRWGRFSVTVQRILPLGEGSIKKSFELLKKKLTKEGLFDPAKKRPLPAHITKIGVISSVNAAGYADFLKILNNRWGGLEIQTINTQVQGVLAPEQIIRALEYHNQRGEVDVIVLLRGGGSADDLAAFNDELLVRAIAASRIPTVTGIGHEIDTSLVDLAADLCASTPSNAAERLSRDRHVAQRESRLALRRISERILIEINEQSLSVKSKLQDIARESLHRITVAQQNLHSTLKILDSLNPETILTRGYAIIVGTQSESDFDVGSELKITTLKQQLTAEVTHVKKR